MQFSSCTLSSVWKMLHISSLRFGLTFEMSPILTCMSATRASEDWTSTESRGVWKVTSVVPHFNFVFLSHTLCKYSSSDCLGSAIFAPIKADIAGNITVSMSQICHSSPTFLSDVKKRFDLLFLLPLRQKIKAVFDTNPARFKTLQHILEAEKEMHGAQWPKVGATLALMWLKRSERMFKSDFCVY